ncbi:MAG: tetraacyldisaccharide 4'-kinase [Candidatus Cloacimonadia bacterium]
MRLDLFLMRRGVLNLLLYPFSLIFCCIVRLRRFLYSKGLFKVYIPKITTISVGNIVGGGSGKTPFTIFLAQTLTKQGYNVAISHRGYKGAYEKGNVIISDENGIREEASIAGDEPLLLCQKLPNLPIIVGKDRSRSIEILQESYPDLDFIILDDSFQHLKVKKSVNIVLFSSLTKLGNGFVYPAGLLREPLSSLKYADFLIYNGDDSVPKFLQRVEKSVFTTNYKVNRLYKSDGETVESSSLGGKMVALISGIGQPKSFEQTMLRSGISFERHYMFPDHHSYSQSKREQTLFEEMYSRYDFLITTEKDYTKLSNTIIKDKLIIVEIKLNFEDSEEFLELLLKNNKEHNQQPSSTE